MRGVCLHGAPRRFQGGVYMADLKIGDSVWIYDANRRVYRQKADGRWFGAPIEREHWAEHFIVAETSKSWLVGYTRDTHPEHPGVYKLSKADPSWVAERGFGRRSVLLSLDAVE